MPTNFANIPAFLKLLKLVYRNCINTVMGELNQYAIEEDAWHKLKQFTPARIALGRAGMSLTTRAHLEFQLAHALARDAVKNPVDFTLLEQRLRLQGIATITLQSQADNLGKYLQRPDLGRLLDESSMANADAVIVVVDGLSSKAIEHHAEPLLGLLLPELQAATYKLAPIHLVKHGRVAIGDVIAEYYNARICIVLIGERPGLSSPDSLGIYFTYQARPFISKDANRNCISNIHGNGLGYLAAIQKLIYLINASEKLQYSGVNLKDETNYSCGKNLHNTGNFLLD
jgi:ethanolamine ammonia-lyase small subunit